MPKRTASVNATDPPKTRAHITRRLSEGKTTAKPNEASKGSSPAKCFVSYNNARTLPAQPPNPLDWT
jgi:hypothetical protein